MNAKNKHSHSDQDGSRKTGGPIYVDAAGRAHLLVDLSENDYRRIDEDEEFGSVAEASLKKTKEPPFRRFDMPRIFEELSGNPIRFADPEHRRFQGKTYEGLLDAEIPGKIAEFEAILNDVRDIEGLHFIFSRLIPDARRIMKASKDPLDGIRNALCYRDPKTQSTLVSALYRFSYMPYGRRLRDFAFSIGIAPYDPRELSAAKIEGYCRHFRGQFSNRINAFDEVQELCDRIASGSYADETNRMGETLFTILSQQLANRLNYEWAARALDVLLNELTDVYDPKVDPIDPFRKDRQGYSVEQRIETEADDPRYRDFASAMVMRIKGFLSDTARYGSRSTVFSTPEPESVANIRSKVQKGYSQSAYGKFS